MSCGNNMKQLGIALHNYHDTYKSFVPRKQGTNGPGSSSESNKNRVSGFIGLLPFMEEVPMYDQIMAGGGGIAPGGPAGWNGWSVWNQAPEGLKCPSGNYTGNPASTNNYVFSVGDQIDNNRDRSNIRGVFPYRNGIKFAHIIDGTSNTIAMSEHLRANFGIGGHQRPLVGIGFRVDIGVRANPGACMGTVSQGYYTDPGDVKGRFGTRWTDGQTERVGFTTVIAPNGPSCGEGRNNNADHAHSIVTPSSNHPGGVMAVFCDGSTQFINETIDTGQLMSVTGWTGVPRGPSPFGVWGELGSKDGGEPVEFP
jgi:hypothetical protein